MLAWLIDSCETLLGYTLGYGNHCGMLTWLIVLCGILLGGLSMRFPYLPFASWTLLGELSVRPCLPSAPWTSSAADVRLAPGNQQ